MGAPRDTSFRLTVLVLAAIALAALGAGLWFRLQERDSTAAAPAAGRAQREPAPRAELAALPDASPGRSAEAAASVPSATPAVPPAAEPQAAPVQPEPEPEKPDLDATRPFRVLVVNQEGVGIADAVVRIQGLRSTASPGSEYIYRGGDDPTATTDVDGRAKLAHWVWVDADGRTCGVDLTVEHPAYVPFRDASVDLKAESEQEPYVVTLARGSTVVVSGWLGAPENRLRGIEVRTDAESGLSSADWERRPDGSLSTSQLSPGAHLLRVMHTSADHGLLFSDILSFELALGDWQAFDLELHPAEVLAGRLDDDVPRPVRDGHVQLCLHQGGVKGGEPGLDSEHEAAVAPDGSFRLEGLPRGSGQVIALCDGWCSKRTRPDTLEQAGMSFSTEPSFEEIEDALRGLGEDAHIPQRVSVPPETLPFVIEMEAAASLRIRVETPEGAPLERALAGASPNVHYYGVGSTIVPWREWYGPTDETGTVLIRDLPPEAKLWVFADHERYEMKAEDRVHNIALAVRSGETAELTITLQPKGQ